MLTYLRRSDHPIVGTSFFVLATAVAVGRADQWKVQHTLLGWLFSTLSLLRCGC
jgi:hypothetical protein